MCLVALALMFVAIGAEAGGSLTDLYESEPFYAELNLGAARQFPEESDHRSTASGGLGFGYQLHRNVALELGYTRFNLFARETKDETFDTSAISLGPKFTFPFGPIGSRVFFELDLAYYQYRYDASVQVGVSGAPAVSGVLWLKKNGWRPMFALGMDYIWSSGLYVALEFSYIVFSIEDADFGFGPRAGEGQAVSFNEDLRHGALGIQYAVGYRF